MSTSQPLSGTARIGLESTDGEQPSHDAIDNFNTDQQSPTYLVFDDITVDLISFVMLAGSFVTAIVVNLSIFRAVLITSVLLAPFRFIFPRPSKPEGVVLLTGASSGIGAELAYIFAKNGHDLILVGRNEEQLTAVRNNIETQYNRKTHVVVTDLSVHGAPRQLYEHVKKQGYIVDVLVNDAGLGHAGDVMIQTDEMAERMVALNCIALIVLTNLFGKDMVQRKKGWILQLSSIVGWMSGPGQNIYHASKHLVRAFSEALSFELRGTGVHNTQLMPGPVHTQFGTRGHLEKTFTFSSSGIVEDPKKVAQAGYDGLCRNKVGVYSSYNAFVTATVFHYMPRALHLTIGSLMNTPTPKTEMEQPKKQQ